MLSSAAQFLPIIGLIVSGELLDKFNERYIIGVGAVGVSVALLLGAIADNSISLLVCLLIVEGFYSSAQLGGAKSVSLWFPQSQRGFAMEIRQAGLPLGGALAGIVLPTSAFVYGIQGAFLVGAIVSFLGGMYIYYFLSLTRKNCRYRFRKQRKSFVLCKCKVSSCDVNGTAYEEYYFFRRFTCDRSICFNHFYNDLFL